MLGKPVCSITISSRLLKCYQVKTLYFLQASSSNQNLHLSVKHFDAYVLRHPYGHKLVSSE